MQEHVPTRRTSSELVWHQVRPHSSRFIGRVWIRGAVEGCRLYQVGNVHGHLLDLGAVELFDFTHHADVISGHEVDGNALTAETTTTTDAVNIVLAVGG